MKLYLAARFERKEEMREVARWLELMGHEVVSTWIQTEAQRKDEERPKVADLIAVKDLDDLDRADAIVAFTEVDRRVRRGGGRHFELGYAKAKGKPMFLVGEPEIIFHWLPGIRIVSSVSELLEVLNGQVDSRARTPGDTSARLLMAGMVHTTE